MLTNQLQTFKKNKTKKRHDIGASAKLPDLERVCDLSGQGQSSDGHPHSCLPSVSFCSESVKKVVRVI